MHIEGHIGNCNDEWVGGWIDLCVVTYDGLHTNLSTHRPTRHYNCLSSIYDRNSAYNEQDIMIMHAHILPVLTHPMRAHSMGEIFDGFANQWRVL